MEALLELPWSAWGMISFGVGVLWTALTLQRLTFAGVILFPFFWPLFIGAWLFAGAISMLLIVMAAIVKSLSRLIFIKPIVTRVPAQEEGGENNGNSQ